MATQYKLSNGAILEVEFTQTGWAQPMGEYKSTALDVEKKGVDFLLTQVCPNVIQWKNGEKEIVTASKLAKLQRNFSWRTDF